MEDLDGVAWHRFDHVVDVQVLHFKHRGGILLLKSSRAAKIPEYFLRNKVYLYYPGTHLIVRPHGTKTENSCVLPTVRWLRASHLWNDENSVLKMFSQSLPQKSQRTCGTSYLTAYIKIQTSPKRCSSIFVHPLLPSLKLTKYCRTRGLDSSEHCEFGACRWAEPIQGRVCGTATPEFWLKKNSGLDTALEG